MESLKDTRTLGAAIARVVPDAAGSQVEGHIRERFDADPSTWDVVRAGVILLQARGFVDLSPDEQDETLRDLEGHPSIALLIRLCVEGFYTSAVGLEAVGFRVTA